MVYNQVPTLRTRWPALFVLEAQLVFPEGPSTQYLWLLGPKAISLMVSGTGDLTHWVLGPSGFEILPLNQTPQPIRTPPEASSWAPDIDPCVGIHVI